MDNNLINFLNNIVKPRDFIFAACASIPIFLLESFNELIIPFISAGQSSIVAAVFGLVISKINDLTYIKSMEKNKPEKKYRKLIKRIKKVIDKPDCSDSQKKIYSSLIVKSENALEFYKDDYINEEELNDRFKKIFDGYESRA